MQYFYFPILWTATCFHAYISIPEEEKSKAIQTIEGRWGERAVNLQHTYSILLDYCIPLSDAPRATAAARAGNYSPHPVDRPDAKHFLLLKLNSYTVIWRKNKKTADLLVGSHSCGFIVRREGPTWCPLRERAGDPGLWRAEDRATPRTVERN